jgi:hypothetical protein
MELSMTIEIAGRPEYRESREDKLARYVQCREETVQY